MKVGWIPAWLQEWEKENGCMTKQEEIKQGFNYERVIEIADRLKELGISERLVKKIKDWARIRQQEELNAR